MDAHDKFVNAHLQISWDNEVLHGHVINWANDSNGNPIGVSSENLYLNLQEYDIEFEDGTRECYAANIFTENSYAQWDDEGKIFLVLKEIIDPQRDPSSTQNKCQDEITP